MTYARRTDRELRCHPFGVESALAAPNRARIVVAAALIAAAAGSWPRSAGAHVEPELMGAVNKAAEGSEAGNAAARAARAAGNAETGGVARFALIVGVNRGVDADLPQLHYADDDAARYSELFGALGVRVHLLTRPDENTLRISAGALSRARPPVRAELASAVAEVAREVATARELGRRVVFYFIYAGHGNVSDNIPYLALEDQRLDTGEIEHQIVDRVHANETHLIIDACYSYSLAYGRGPGGISHPVGPFAPPEGLARRPDVGLLLSTTSARESHEWSNFQAGIFSHEVRSGLFGAADLDGDGQVSYLEIAAFVSRANDAVPNERYRPRVFAHAPREASQLVDLRQAPGRRLTIEAASAGAHYLLEDLLGVRLADFHCPPGQSLSLVVPVDAQPLFLRRVDDGQQLAIPAGAQVVSVGALARRGPNHGMPDVGPAEYAFSRIFSLPFDQQALASYSARPQDSELPVLATEVESPLPSLRFTAGYVALGTAVAATLVAGELAVSAEQLSREDRDTRTSGAAKALDRRIDNRVRGVQVALGVAGAAALTGGLLLLWPRSPVQATPVLVPGSSSGMLGLTGGF